MSGSATRRGTPLTVRQARALEARLDRALEREDLLAALRILTEMSLHLLAVTPSFAAEFRRLAEKALSELRRPDLTLQQRAWLALIARDLATCGASGPLN